MLTVIITLTTLSYANPVSAQTTLVFAQDSNRNVALNNGNPRVNVGTLTANVATLIDQVTFTIGTSNSVAGGNLIIELQPTGATPGSTIRVVQTPILDSTSWPTGSTQTVNAVTTLSIPIGTYNIFFEKTASGNFSTRTAATQSLSAAPDLTEEGSSISASPTSLTADGSSTSSVTVTVVDANDNPISGEAVSILADGTSIGSGTSGIDGAFNATYTAGTTTGSVVLSFTVAGAPATNTATIALTAGVVDLTARGSSISASPTSLAADGASTSTVTVTVVDANNNPISGETIVILADGTSIGSGTSGIDGTFNATYTAGTTTGSVALSFTVAGAPATNTATIALTAGVVDLTATGSSISASPTSLAADGNSTSLVTVSVVDVHGNPITGSLVEIFADSGSIGPVTDNGDGTHHATFTAGTVAGPVVLSFTVDDLLADRTATLTIAPGNPDLNVGGSTIVASPANLPADGEATSAVTVTVVDVGGNPISGVQIDIFANGISIGSGNSANDGTFTATFTAGTISGEVALGFTVDGATATSLAIIALFDVETVQTVFDRYREEVRSIVFSDAERSLRSRIGANWNMLRSARERFIAAQQIAACANGEISVGCDKIVNTNDVPFGVDAMASGTDGALSTRGTFFGQRGVLSGDSRRLVFGSFDVQHDQSTGSTTYTLDTRLAWERSISERTMLGYFIGAEAAKSDIQSTTFLGQNLRNEVSTGAYGVTKLNETLFADGFVTFGLGKNNLDIANDEISLESDYKTRSAMIGGSVSGIMAFERFELRPELSFSYGKTWIDDVTFAGAALGETDENLGLEGGTLTMAQIAFRPEFRFSIDENPNNLVSVAPMFACEAVRSLVDREGCGVGAEIGIQSISEDGLDRFNTGVSFDKISGIKRTSFMLSIERRF
ncbi:MAG: invasin domain 3-containing protein [Rhodobacterales bacterium]